MKKMYDALSAIATFVFFYNFSWELYPALILGAFSIAFTVSNIFDMEKDSFTPEEYFLFIFAFFAVVTVYMSSNWIGMIAMGAYIMLLIQKGTLDDKPKKGMTNKEFYGRKRS